MISVADPVDRDVTAILSEAFRDDPVLRWIKNAPAFVPSFFEMILPAFIEKGLTYIDDGRRGAAAIRTGWPRPTSGRRPAKASPTCWRGWPRPCTG